MRVALDDFIIPDVESTKFLGVHVDSSLSWDVHVESLCGKLLVNLHLIRMAKNILSPRCLKLIYHAHIQSHLSYGLLIWGSMISKRKLQHLILLPNSCVRLLSKQTKWYPTNLIYKEEKILQLDDLITLELCKFGHRLTCKYLPKPIMDLMETRGGKKNIGMKHDTNKHQTYRNIMELASIEASCVRGWQNLTKFHWIYA